MSDKFCVCGHKEIIHGMSVKARAVEGVPFLVPDTDAGIERTGCGAMGCPCRKFTAAQVEFDALSAKLAENSSAIKINATMLYIPRKAYESLVFADSEKKLIETFPDGIIVKHNGDMTHILEMENADWIAQMPTENDK